MMNNFLRDTRRYLRKAGVELTAPSTLHTFRKSFAQNHADAGTPPRTLAKLLGHSNTRVTLQFYNRVTDANDTKYVDEDFASSSNTFTYCNAGNLVQDEKFTYTYDAWNRLVKVVSRADSDVTIHTASYDGQGRRLKKVVTNAGQYDGTVVFYYDGWKIIETRDGSGNQYQQFIHGTQYIDELVMMRVKDKGDFYVHQDANWNVIALTDLGGNVVQRNTYTPYGQMTANQVTSYGDRDGDRVVDSTDKGTPGTTCTGTVSGECRLLDLDFDGDYDAADATLFDSLDQGLARHPAKTASAVDFPFGHQGLYYDAELGSYQNRHRQYDPVKMRFLQRDPFALEPRPGAGYHDGVNLFRRAHNNTSRFRDPYGLWERPRDDHVTPFEGWFWGMFCALVPGTTWEFCWPICDPGVPVFNCHGYAFGMEEWVQPAGTHEGGGNTTKVPDPPPDSYPVPCPDYSTTDPGPEDDPCPEGYDFVYQAPTTDGGGHSMVFICDEQGCGWYQKCGHDSINGPHDNPDDAMQSCNYHQTTGTSAKCSCVPSS